MFRVFVHGLKLIKTRTVALVKSILKITRKGTPISSKISFIAHFGKNWNYYWQGEKKVLY